MYSKEQLDKIGNAVIFLSKNIQDISKTKLLKLLYVLDELSITKSGIPFFNLKYKVWKFGPVAEDLFVEFSSAPFLLRDYIERKSVNEHDVIVPKKEFCDDEFSLNDIKLMEYVVNVFKGYTAEQLIRYTHRKNSLWYNVALKNNVLDLLEKECINTTDFVIDFSELIEHDPRKLGIYKECLEVY